MTKMLATTNNSLSLVTETWTPEINGVAMTLSNLASGLKSKGWDVQIVRPKQASETSGHDKRVGDFNNCLVPSLPIPGYAGLRFGLPVYFRLKKLWKSNPPNVVHIATEGPLGWAAMKVAKSLNIPVTTTFHTNFQNYCGHYSIGWLNSMVMRYLRDLHNQAKYTLVPSKTSQSLLIEEGYQNVDILGRGIDVSLYEPSHRDDVLRKCWGVGEEDVVAIHVGRMAAEKNLDNVAKSFSLFQKKHPKAKMVWVGDGPETKRIQKDYPQHIFAGMRTGEDLAKHYASADMFIFASLSETYGNVVTEAMASGLAVVAFDYAAAGNLIEHRKNGLLASMNDFSSFLHQIDLLADKPALIKQIGALAPVSLSNHSWNKVCDDFEGYLIEAMQQPSSAKTFLLSQSN